MNVFTSSAAELEALKERVYEAARHRNEGPEQLSEWVEASRAFFAVFDRLAFPTGFKRELTRLREGDLEAIELAVRFLEADPWYFRSGYNKAEIIRHLRKHTFTEGQSARLRKVIHERVLGRPVREMRSYAQLASKISNPAFEALLKDLAASSDHRTARHATWILTAVKNANVSRRNT